MAGRYALTVVTFATLIPTPIGAQSIGGVVSDPSGSGAAGVVVIHTLRYHKPDNP